VLDYGLPFAIPANTVIDQDMKSSPRKIIKEVYDKAILKYPTLTRPPWLQEMMAKGEAAFVVRILT